MKQKRILVIVIEFILLVTVIAGVYYYSNSLVEPTKVFSFRSNLETGEVITKEKLAVVELPSSAVNENFLRDKDLIIGNVVTTDVSKGQFVLTDLVAKQEYLNPIKTMDLSKMRKVSFPIKIENSLAGDIKKGDIIDLAYLAISDNKDTGQEFVYSKIFMPEVVVWSVNTKDGYEYYSKSTGLDDNYTSVSGEQVTEMDSNSYGDLGSITVIVTGSQAEEIMTRSTAGQIQILGRFTGAEEAESTGYSIYTPSDVYSGNIDPENGQFDIDSALEETVTTEKEAE